MNKDDFIENANPSPQSIERDERIRELRAEVRKLKARVGGDELLFEYLRQSIQQVKPPNQRYSPKVSKDKPILVPVLVTADQHAEEYVSKGEMEGENEYSFEIFQHRMGLMGRKALQMIEIMRKSHTIDDLRIWCLGDWFMGKIQPQEEAWGNSMPFPAAVARVPGELAGLIRGLSPHFKGIHITGVSGNHGRETPKTPTKMTALRNWDTAVHMIAKEMTSTLPNVSWSIPESFYGVDMVEGYRCFLLHGGNIKMNGRTPYYPIETRMQKEAGKRVKGGGIDYAFMGHFHHRAILDGWIHICPSMIGTDQYAKYLLGKSDPPAQSLFFFHKGRGIVDDMTLRLDGEEEHDK